MKKIKNQKGITLIALVVTIIILLILAGVALSLVAGENGILKRATNAVDKHNEAAAKEQVELLIADYQAEWYEAKYVNGTEPGSQREYIAKKLNGATTDDYFIETETSEDGTIHVYVSGGSGKPIVSGILQGDSTAKWDEKMEGIVISYSLNPSGYTNGNITLTLNASSSDGSITDIQSTLSKNEDGTYTISENGEYRFVATNSKGERQSKTVTITNIDKIKPNDFELKIEKNVADGEFTIIANVEDAEETKASAKSGIDRFEHYIKKDGESEYKKYETVDNEYKVSGLTESGKYSVYTIVYDKAGNWNETEIVEVSIVALKNRWNLGSENSDFITYQGTPNYKGNIEGLYLEDSIIATKENYSLSNNYTIILETKNIEQNGAGFMVAMGSGGSGIGGRCLGMGRWTTGIYNAFSGAGDGYTIQANQELYDSGKWHISAIRFDGTKFSYFVDNKKIGSSNASGLKNSPLYIGGISNSGTSSAGVKWGYGNGYYRNLAIYDGALSDEELENYSF